MKHKRTMVFDFDGVLHSSPHDDGHSDYNFDLIRQAHQLGYPVAVSTCASIGGVAQHLEDAGFDVYQDRERRIGQNGWNGGPPVYHGRLILVTNMKVHGHIVDDNAFRYNYGDSEAGLWKRVAEAEMAHKNRRIPA